MKEVEHIFVVCGEAGEPLRAYKTRENAEKLLDHWESGAMKIRGSIKTIDLVEAANTGESE